jgi:hypothetical protein
MTQSSRCFLDFKNFSATTVNPANDWLEEIKTPNMVEILTFLMLLIVFAANGRYNCRGE